ncbi:MAG: biopolymer transporter Tol, partial [Bdellovibrionales bacterium]|nr:biopolymer transporter Tol [Bdellovibrionales bacterium]
MLSVLRMAVIFGLLILASTSWGLANQVEKAEADQFLTGLHQLTLSGSRSGEGYFRLDGNYMVFQSERDVDNPFYQIYLMNLVSGETKRISPGHGKTTCSWVHPLEEKVLYASTHLDKEAKAKQKDEFKQRA